MRTQAETWDELLENVREAIEGCLTVEIDGALHRPGTRVLEIAI